MKILLTLDPGQTTGYTLWNSSGEGWVFDRSGIFPTWEKLGLIDEANIVVYEVVRGKHPSFNPIGIEVMGVVRYLAGDKAVPQYPHALTGPSKWPHIKQALKLFKTQHEKDAFLHAIVYFENRGALYVLPKR